MRTPSAAEQSRRPSWPMVAPEARRAFSGCHGNRAPVGVLRACLRVVVGGAAHPTSGEGESPPLSNTEQALASWAGTFDTRSRGTRLSSSEYRMVCGPPTMCVVGAAARRRRGGAGRGARGRGVSHVSPQVLVDGNLFHVAVITSTPLEERIAALLETRAVRLLVSPCVLAELGRLGRDFAATLDAARGAQAGHRRRSPSPSAQSSHARAALPLQARGRARVACGVPRVAPGCVRTGPALAPR